MRLTALRDISLQKQAEEIYQIHGIRDCPHEDIVYWADEAGNLVYVNNAACEKLGYSREEFLKMGVPDLMPTSNDFSWSNHWASLKNKLAISRESQHRNKT